MAGLSDEKWREMEAEMDRFEEEISAPNFGLEDGEDDPANRVIIGAKTFTQVQARLEHRKDGPPSINYGALPPPPPPPSFGQTTAPQGPQMPANFNRCAPPPPPPSQPSFMPPQLRHRHPAPPRMRPPPPPPLNRPMGPPPMGHPHPRGPPMCGPPRPMMPHQRPPFPCPSGPMGGPPGGPGGFFGPGPQMNKPPEKPANIIEAPKVVYSAPPVKSEAALQKELEKKEKKRKKKKLKTEHNPDGSEVGSENVDGVEMDSNQEVAAGIELNVPVDPMGGDPGYAEAFAEYMAATSSSTDVTKKEKKEKKKKFIRTAAGTVWEDPTLGEWENDDFRIFCGDLGNEVTDESLIRVFSKYPSFVKAKVVRDKRTNKTKGFGFASFRDPNDFARAMREMNGKYVGNRPIKLRKSQWRDRQIDIVRKKEKEKKRLGFR